jgi:anti-anti-sigma regulatory factor
MLKIERTVGADETMLKLSGEMNAENLAELEALLSAEKQGRPIVLDLKDLTLVDREAVKSLERVESNTTRLVNCPLYIREWITRERNAK